MPAKAPMPDKLYFRIKEVTEITGLAAYVLRFWESEFPAIRPKRTESGQRLYRKSDIETILKIKYLLYEKKFTIQGARKHLKSKDSCHGTEPANSFLDEIAAELESIRELLDK